MRDGEWHLGYSSADNFPGAALTFGLHDSGIYCLSEPDVTFADADLGDAALPGEDGIRMGRDYQRAATVTLELGVDGVDGPVDRHWPMRPWTRGDRVGEWTDFEMAMAFFNKRDQGPAIWASDGVDLLRQAWRGDSVSRKSGRVAWLVHHSAGRSRQLYGRPRKFAVSHSRLTKQGYTPVVAEFAAVDDRFYDATEKHAEMWDYLKHGRPGRPGRNIAEMAEYWWHPSQKTASVKHLGKTTTFPVLVIHGPCKNPKVSFTPGLWSVQLSMTIASGDYVTIDPRPWARTVTHTKGSSSSSVADKLTRSSPRLAEMYLPPGYWTANLSYTRSSDVKFDGPRVEVKWRDAFTWW
jgi:hypothetical protein